MPSVKTPTEEELKGICFKIFCIIFFKKLIITAAEEKAAKKSRIKQSLVKRARSVAIFSLKLKERRAREAEKQAQAAIDHAKVCSFNIHCILLLIKWVRINKENETIKE